MEIKCKFDKCIICLASKPGAPEHIIPQVIGGRLSAKILCDQCNQTFGSKLVSEIKKNPTIYCQIKLLENILPSIAKRFYEGLDFTLYGNDEQNIDGVMKNGIIQVKPKQDKGKLILDKKSAERYIKQALSKRNIADIDIDRVICNYRNLSPNEKFYLPSGEEIMKKTGQRVFPKLSPNDFDNRLAILMAYEYLALCIGENIYHSYFDNCRNYLMRIQPCNEIKVEYFQAGKKNEPIHVIFIERKEKYTKIHIRLFRWFAIIVTFYGFSSRGYEWVFVDDLLEVNGCHWASSMQNAKDNIWDRIA